MKVLVVDTFRLGDAVYTGALIEAVRREVGELEIDVLCSRLVQHSGILSGIADAQISIDPHWLKRGWYRSPARVLWCYTDAWRKLRGAEYDNVVFPRGAAVEKLLTARARVRKSYAHNLNYLPGAGARVMGYHREHVFVSRTRLLRRILSDQAAELQWPYLEPRSISGGPQPVVLFAPEASTSAKCWPATLWKELGVALRSKGLRVVLITTDTARSAVAACGCCDEIFSGSVDALRRLISKCDVVVAIDSFVGHCAAAQGCCVVSLFGPTDPNLWRPWGSRVKVISAGDHIGIKFERKAIERLGLRSMSKIRVSEVVEAVHYFLSKPTV